MNQKLINLPTFKLKNITPIKLFPIREIRKNKKLLGKQFYQPVFFGTEYKKWDNFTIDISLHERFLFKREHPLGVELAWIRMNITDKVVHRVPLPGLITDLLQSNNKDSYSPHIRISGFSIHTKLQGNSIGSNWYNKYIEPFIISTGINIIRVEGSCLNRDGFRF